MPFASQFRLPQSTIELLGEKGLHAVSPALKEAICAVTCALTSSLANYAREHEFASTMRCEVVSRQDLEVPTITSALLFDVQALTLLAHLAFANYRTLEGHRHLGGAIRIALALRLDQSPHFNVVETWQMVQLLDQEWSSASVM